MKEHPLLRYRWGFSLLFLTLLQGAILMKWSPFPPTESEFAESDVAALLALAEETQDVWRTLVPKAREVPEAVDENATEDELALERATLLLRLRSLEASLADGGTDIHLSAITAQWLAAHTGEGMAEDAELQSRIHHYLNGLLAWCESCGPTHGAYRLERVHLLPGGEGFFPQVAIEMSGAPDHLGNTLFSVLHAQPDWALKELELLRSTGGHDWWLRGSFSFGGDL